MTWQKIGDAARDVTERLEPRVLNLTVYQVSQAPQVFKNPITSVERKPLVLKIIVERKTA
jgi:hypothetical protein